MLGRFKKKRTELDYLQHLMVNAASPEDKSTVNSYLRGQVNVPDPAIATTVMDLLGDVLENMAEVGVKRAAYMYRSSTHGWRNHINSGISESIALNPDEVEAVQRIADQLMRKDSDWGRSKLGQLNTADARNLTWGNLVKFSRLTDEYNLDWALASFEWE